MRERERVSKIYAIDISQNMLEMAAKNAKEAGVEEKIVFLRTEGKKLDFESNFFDIVMCSNMLHHLKDPVELLKEMKRVVKKEGCIAIRDVIRPPSKFILNLYVEVFGLPYSKLMKKGYRKSLYSAFSIKELKYMLTRSGITGVKMFKSFPHFVTFIKEAK